MRDKEGHEYRSSEHIELRMWIDPREIETGEMAFEIPEGLSSVTLEVTQNIVREEGTKVIYTQEIPL